MKMLLVLAPLAILAGCSTLNRETIAEETTYQAVNALDATQTVHMVGDHPNIFRESGELGINGKHPDRRAIITYQVTSGLLHFGITYLLSRGEPGPTRQWWIRAWEVGTLGVEAQAVIHNYHVNGDNVFPTRAELAQYDPNKGRVLCNPVCQYK